jgi:hypothetical protein
LLYLKIAGIGFDFNRGCGSENADNWNWFIDENNSFMNINQPNVILISDGEKGIINVLI